MEPTPSAAWYRVAALRPRVGADVRFHRHVVRGEEWFVVRNPETGTVHRLTPAARALVGWMDGTRTAQQVRDAAAAQLGDEAPTQDEVVELLGMLHAADLLRCDVSADTTELFRRWREEADRERSGRRSLLAYRIPLLDPDAFLTRWQGWTRPLFSRAGALLWCALVGSALLAALRHAGEIAAASDSLLEPSSLMAVWLVYPVVKALHELGHAFAVKRWGGEVHEMGVLFLVFVPVPYVDASAASVYPEKSRRMVVGAAGIAVELFLAAMATWVWLAVEPGVVRQVAWAVMVIGGASTLFFNGNPLLRFDGYYVLADALEIPNLAAKGNRTVGALARRHVLGLRETPLPDAAPGERPWLVGYALASFAYRIAVLVGIALFLADRFLALGVALAVYTLIARLALPCVRSLASALGDPAVVERPARVWGGALGAAGTFGLLAFALPLPLHTRADGVVWLPERSHVRPGADGFVTAVLAEPHAAVRMGQPLIETRDPGVEARLRVLEAERRELALRVHALVGENRVRAEIARAQLAEADAALARARERARDGLIRSPAAGVFVPADGADLNGRFVRQGEVVAWVVDLAAASARVVLSQHDVALVRERTRAAWVRLAHDPGAVHAAHIGRQVPAASNRLPARALGAAGGGPFAVDPLDREGLRTLEPVFQLELSLPASAAVRGAGERVHVRFDHGAEPLAPRVWRAARRLFLGRLGV